MVSELNMSHGKMFGCFIPIAWVHLVIKLRNFDFESHRNILIFFIKRDMVSGLNMSYGRMSNCFILTALGSL